MEQFKSPEEYTLGIRNWRTVGQRPVGWECDITYCSIDAIEEKNQFRLVKEEAVSRIISCTEKTTAQRMELYCLTTNRLGDVSSNHTDALTVSTL